MENIEELKQANEKLTERLNNAAKFFREQKAQIEALTKENEELKRTPKEEVIDTEKWNKLVIEKENLKKEKEELEKKFKEQQDFEANNINKVVPELEEKVRSLEAQEEAYKKEIVNLQGQLIKSNEDLQNKINQIKTIDLEQKKIIEARDQWMGMAKELEKKSKEFEDKIKEQDKEYNKLSDIKEKLAKAYDNLENEKMAYASDYEILENKFKKLNDDYVSLENTKDAYSNSDDALKEIIAILNKHGFESSDEIKPKEEKKVLKTGTNPMNGEMIRMV